MIDGISNKVHYFIGCECNFNLLCYDGLCTCIAKLVRSKNKILFYFL
jgi:hypothetical protein